MMFYRHDIERERIRSEEERLSVDVTARAPTAAVILYSRGGPIEIDPENRPRPRGVIIAFETDTVSMRFVGVFRVRR